MAPLLTVMSPVLKLGSIPGPPVSEYVTTTVVVVAEAPAAVTLGSRWSA